MRSATREIVDQWVADLLGMSVSTVWHPGVSVVGHVGLGEYPGIWVLRRADAVRVSVPPAMDEAVAGELADRAPDELVDPAFWRRSNRHAASWCSARRSMRSPMSRSRRHHPRWNGSTRRS